MKKPNDNRHALTCLVTGASSGIGREFARQLAARGHNVLLVSNQACELAETAAELSALHPGGRFPTFCIDLAAPGADTRLLDFCHADGLEIDLLVNNAGIFSFCAVADTPPERIDLFIDLHIRAVTHLCRTFAADMKRRGCHGYILNMSSMSCWMPMPGIAMYSATKAYIRVLSRSLAVELADDGITVMVACPGGIATDLFGLPRRLQRLGVRLGVLSTPPPPVYQRATQPHSHRGCGTAATPPAAPHQAPAARPPAKINKNVRNRPTSVVIADIFIKQKAFLIPSGAGIS